MIRWTSDVQFLTDEELLAEYAANDELLSEALREALKAEIERRGLNV